MVTFRTETLVFTRKAVTHDSNGYPVEGATTSISLLCRPEPDGNSRKVAAPNGDLVTVKFKVYSDLFTDDLQVGMRTTCRGQEVEVIEVHHYQLHVEIWLA